MGKKDSFGFSLGDPDIPIPRMLKECEKVSQNMPIEINRVRVCGEDNVVAIVPGVESIAEIGFLFVIAHFPSAFLIASRTLTKQQSLF